MTLMFQALLGELRSRSLDPHEKGRRSERLVDKRPTFEIVDTSDDGS